MNQVKIKAPAKVNLFLEIHSKREDGYHELETLIHAIDLCDQITMTSDPTQTTLSSNDIHLPVNQDNLILKAAQLLRNYTKTNFHAKIYLEKNIPIAAGLGGGSSDGAAALIGLNHLWNLKLSLDELKLMSRDLGADVPYFFEPGLSLCLGIGQDVQPLPFKLPGFIIILNPGFGISTQKIYESIELEKFSKFKKSDILLNSIKKNDFKLIQKNIFNRLDSIACAEYPKLLEIKKEMENLLGQSVTVSGSGATLFSLFETQSHVQEGLGKLKKSFHSTFIYAGKWWSDPFISLLDE